MLRIFEAGLIVAVVTAVLAFGGTEPFYFSFVQILLLGLGLVLILGYGSPSLARPRLPVAIPLVLVGLVLLQLAPLPVFLVQLIGGNPLPNASYAAISLAPQETLAHLLLLLTYLAGFYVTIVICQQRDGRRHLIYGLLALGAFEAFYGLIQYLTGWQQIFGYKKIFNLEEATGTYINRNHFAGLLELILPFALALVAYHLGKLSEVKPAGATTRDFFAHAEIQKSISWLFVAVVLFAALVFSHSRTGIISALVSFLAMATLILTSRKQRIAGAVLAILFVSSGISMAIWIGPEPVITRFEALNEEYRATGTGRGVIWQDTFRLIGQHSWLGSGFGTFPTAYTSTQTAHLSNFVNHAHNDYLEIVSDIGIVGAVLLFGSILFTLKRAVEGFSKGNRFERAVSLACTGSLVAILLHSLTDFNLYIPANTLVFAVILGLACSTKQPKGEGS